MSESASIWYDPATTLSHNCIWNMVLSMRGGGKTFGCLELVTRRWLSKRRRFIYLRRTDAELQLCKDHLMNAVQAEGHFGEHQFKTIGYDIYCDDEVMGYCIALSKAYQMKSVAYPDVDYIIFDEFLIEDKNGHYLPNEPHKVLALMETVGRMRDIKIIMLANFVSKANVYFDFWHIHPKANAIFTKHPTKPILIHMYSNQNFKDKKALTPFAKLIEGTAYGGYILDNNALSDNYTFIEPLTGNADFWFTIKFQGLNMGVWFSQSKGNVYINSKNEPNTRNVFAFDTDSQEPNIMLFNANRNNPHLKRLKFAIDNGLCRFENISIKNAILEMLNYL